MLLCTREGASMGETGMLTIRLPKADLERLSTLASSTGRSKSSLASEALAAYLAAQEWQVTAISEALEAAYDATAIEHSRVASWLRSWGTEDELTRPR